MTIPPREKQITSVGILVNGVELYPASVFDEEIFFGQIDSIEVTNAGKDFDVINGPPLIIQDQSLVVGLLHLQMLLDHLKKLISPGIGYQEKPKITVSGGNGVGAVLESNFVKGRIVSSFKGFDGNGVNVASDTIDFPDPHNFELGEEVIYESNNNVAVGGIVDKSSYFARPIDNKTISLHSSRSDAVSGINTVNIGSVSNGFHSFKTLKG